MLEKLLIAPRTRFFVGFGQFFDPILQIGVHYPQRAYLLLFDEKHHFIFLYLILLLLQLLPHL